MYPYNLDLNPYPSSPTPTEKDAKILGGKRHKEAKTAIVECVKELNRKVEGKTAENGDFRVVTVVQDVGSGKTHLALHVKSIKGRHNAECSYVDLSTISPKTVSGIYDAILKGFDNEFFVQLRSKLLNYLKENAEQGDNSAKKALDYTFVNKLTGMTIKEKTEDIIAGKQSVSLENLTAFLMHKFEYHESVLIKNVISNSFDEIKNLETLIGMLFSMSKLTHRFLGKILIYEIDELDGNKDSIEFVKGIINAHLPASVLLLITTPSGYLEIQNTNPSMFDRLEKANYKIDLAGSNSKDELAEIVTEYIKHSDKDGKFGSEEQQELNEKIQVLYDEFTEFRNVRSVINILYQAMEKATQSDSKKIDESVIDEAIRQSYPGLRVRGSIMNIPISDFLTIRRNEENNGAEIKNAVKNLTVFAQEMGTIKKLEKQNLLLDAVYQDNFGSKIGLAVIANELGIPDLEQISDMSKAAVVDKLIILTNKKIQTPYNATVVTMDKSKVVDLIYFNNKYAGKKIIEEDNERIELLAKTLSII
jgi:ribosome recycling factor